MSEAFFEKVDVFLPGQGETLAQAPAYHWERTEHATGHIYYSTREPKSVLIHLKGISREERDALSSPAMGMGPGSVLLGLAGMSQAAITAGDKKRAHLVPQILKLVHELGPHNAGPRMTTGELDKPKVGPAVLGPGVSGVFHRPIHSQSKRRGIPRAGSPSRTGHPCPRRTKARLNMPSA